MAEKWIIEFSYGNMTPNHPWSPWAPLFEGVYTTWGKGKVTGEDTPMKPRTLQAVLDKMAETMQRASVKNAVGRLRYRARRVDSDETIPCEIFV